MVVNTQLSSNPFVPRSERLPSRHPEDPLRHVQPGVHPHLHTILPGFHWVSEPAFWVMHFLFTVSHTLCYMTRNTQSLDNVRTLVLITRLVLVSRHTCTVLFDN